MKVKKIFLFILFILIFIIPLFAIEKDFYSQFINYLKNLQKEKEISLSLFYNLIIFFFDFFVSFICLYLSIGFFTYEWRLVPKPYFWFIFIFNVSWLCLLFIFKFLWIVFDFLVVKLRPDLAEAIFNFFMIILLFSVILLYLWLIMRCFSVSFWGGFKIFLLSHFLYFISLSFISFLPFEYKIKEFIKKELSFPHNFKIYIKDLEKIKNEEDIIFSFKIRKFHL